MIYFVESDGLIKIGFSDHVRRRTGDIISQQRLGGMYLGYMAGDRQVEKFLHKRFADDREYGEWFRASEALRSFIVTVADTGYPTDASTPFGSQKANQEEIFCEAAAESIRAFVKASKLDLTSGLAKAADWAGIEFDRLKAIYNCDVPFVSAGELATITALGEAAGAHSLEKLAEKAA